MEVGVVVVVLVEEEEAVLLFGFLESMCCNKVESNHLHPCFL